MYVILRVYTDEAGKMYVRVPYTPTLEGTLVVQYLVGWLYFAQLNE